MKSMNSIFGNVDDLFLFCLIVEEGSLSKAAVRLNLPASTVSRRMKSLEQKLGISLLALEKRELVATPVGMRWYDAIHQNLWQVDSTVASLQHSVNRLNGRVRITVPRAFYYDVVRWVVRDMLKQYPAVSIEVFIHQSPMVASLDTDTDVMMVFNDLTELNDCVARPMYKTKLGIYAHRDFFKDKAFPRTIRDLEQYDWISNYSTTTVPVFRNEKLCDMLQTNVRMVVNDIHAQADEIRRGLGIGSLPIAKAAKHPELVRIFPELSTRIRQSYLVYRKRKYQPLLIEETVRRIVAEAEKWFLKHNDWHFERANPCIEEDSNALDEADDSMD